MATHSVLDDPQDVEEFVVKQCIDHIEVIAGAEDFGAVPRELLRRVLKDGQVAVANDWLREALQHWAQLQLQSQAVPPAPVFSAERCLEYVRDLLPPATLFTASNRDFVLNYL